MKKGIRCFGALLAAMAMGVSLAAEKAKAPAVTPPTAAAGQATGAFTVDGKTFKLAYAAAFVDQKDERKPVVLLITEEAVPAAGWTSDFDIMNYRMDKHQLIGVGFWIDNKGEVYRSEYYDGGFPTSTSGYFDLKLGGPMGKTLTGSIKSTAAAASGSHKVALEATFTASVP
jgi:hypothetical protein